MKKNALVLKVTKLSGKSLQVEKLCVVAIWICSDVICFLCFLFSVGLSHDGDHNECAKDTSLGSIMAPQVYSRFDQYYWSNCTRRQIHQNLRLVFIQIRGFNIINSEYSYNKILIDNKKRKIILDLNSIIFRHRVIIAVI